MWASPALFLEQLWGCDGAQEWVVMQKTRSKRFSLRSLRTCGAAVSCCMSCWSARIPLSGQRTSMTTKSCRK